VRVKRLREMGQNRIKDVRISYSTYLLQQKCFIPKIRNRLQGLTSHPSLQLYIIFEFQVEY